jgi:hypothetical protein
MPDEVFSEQQVTEIIRRAVQIQEKESSTSKTYTPGITRDELERVANEMGVSVDSLRQAIDEAKGPRAKRSVLGLGEGFERVVEGEIDPNDFDVVASMLRGKNIGRGGVTQVGRSMGGQSWVGTTLSNVDVTSRNGRTKVVVKPTIFGPFMLGAYPALIGTIISASALGEKGYVAAAIASAAAFVTAGVVAFFTLRRKSISGAEDFADKLRDRIADHLRDSKAHEATKTAEVEQELHQRIGEV